MTTVRDLIKKLRKMPQDLIVATAAHDNSQNEIQDFINNAAVVDFDVLPKDKDFPRTGKLVVLTS